MLLTCNVHGTCMQVLLTRLSRPATKSRVPLWPEAAAEQVEHSAASLQRRQRTRNVQQASNIEKHVQVRHSAFNFCAALLNALWICHIHLEDMQPATVLLLQLPQVFSFVRLSTCCNDPEQWHMCCVKSLKIRMTCSLCLLSCVLDCLLARVQCLAARPDRLWVASYCGAYTAAVQALEHRRSMTKLLPRMSHTHHQNISALQSFSRSL